MPIILSWGEGKGVKHMMITRLMLSVHAAHHRPLLTLGLQEHNGTRGKGLTFLVQEFRPKTNIMIKRETNVLRQPERGSKETSNRSAS